MAATCPPTMLPPFYIPSPGQTLWAAVLTGSGMLSGLFDLRLRLGSPIHADARIELALCARWWQDPIFNQARWCTSGIVQQVQGFNNQVRAGRARIAAIALHARPRH
jgi:hypothetical protein